MRPVKRFGSWEHRNTIPAFDRSGMVFSCERRPGFHLKDTSFIGQCRLFDRLGDEFGETPPALDSDDLPEDPGRVVKAWCDADGIPVIPDALRWEPGARDEVSRWDGGSFHENLRNSDSLKRQPSSNMDIAKAPDRAREICETVLPHDEHLSAHRLTAPAAKPAQRVKLS